MYYSAEVNDIVDAKFTDGTTKKLILIKELGSGSTATCFLAVNADTFSVEEQGNLDDVITSHNNDINMNCDDNEENISEDDDICSDVSIELYDTDEKYTVRMFPVSDHQVKGTNASTPYTVDNIKNITGFLCTRDLNRSLNCPNLECVNVPLGVVCMNLQVCDRNNTDCTIINLPMCGLVHKYYKYTLSDLFDLYEDTGVPADIAKTILISLAHALRAIDREQLVHTDIKPCNILLDENYNAIITDTDSFSPLFTSQKHAVYTYKYAAPELMSGELIDSSTHTFPVAHIIHKLFNGVDSELYDGNGLELFSHDLFNDLIEKALEELSEEDTHVNRLIRRIIVERPDCEDLVRAINEVIGEL